MSPILFHKRLGTPCFGPEFVAGVNDKCGVYTDAHSTEGLCHLQFEMTLHVLDLYLSPTQLPLAPKGILVYDLV